MCIVFLFGFIVALSAGWSDLACIYVFCQVLSDRDSISSFSFYVSKPVDGMLWVR